MLSLNLLGYTLQDYSTPYSTIPYHGWGCSGQVCLQYHPRTQKIKPFQQPAEVNTRRTWMLFALWTKGWGWELAFWMQWPLSHFSRRVHAPWNGKRNAQGSLLACSLGFWPSWPWLMLFCQVSVFFLGRGTEHMPVWHRLGNRDQSIQSALDYLFQQDWAEMLVELGWTAYMSGAYWWLVAPTQLSCNVLGFINWHNCG